ncbi:MAG: nitroreductase family deazaflavin-dependent oxidoreductase [Nitrolancea sp.]
MSGRSARETGQVLPHRPNRVLRVALKTPSVIYALNMGWIFGHRFLLLTHRGRKSGLIHRTPLEVIHYDRPTHTSTVISAWGEKSDWYRNIQKSPALQIQTGLDRYVPLQRILREEERDHELELYAKNHGPSAMILSRMFRFKFADDPEERHKFASACRMVAFRPRLASEDSPNPRSDDARATRHFHESQPPDT